jgi:hypothetical protein
VRHAQSSRISALDSIRVLPQFVEEVLDDLQLAGGEDVVVDVRADREVEHGEAAGREGQRTVARDGYPPGITSPSVRQHTVAFDGVPCLEGP